MIGRRRFVSIAAGAGLSALIGGNAKGAPSGTPLYRWKGVAMGAAASIAIAHENAAALVERAQAEISRLEAIFSLYRTDSALSRLNAKGRLAAPPPEMIELFALCDALHALTGGAFDPTIQPLWKLYAESLAVGTSPSDREIEQALAKTGWRHVVADSNEVAFTTPSLAVTLNGIAQGYISDKIAALLRSEGVSNVLVDIGEIVALGHQPDGTGWRIGIADPSNPGRARTYRRLANSAIATSAPLGTVFDTEGSVGHILDPRTGRPAGRWRQVSVIAPAAARADGLSTAFCLMEEPDIRRAARGLQVELVR